MAGPTLDSYVGILSDVSKQEGLEYHLIFKGTIKDISHFLDLKTEEANDRTPYNAELKGLLGKINVKYYIVQLDGWTLLFVDSIEATVHFKIKYGYENCIRGENEFLESLRPPKPEIREFDFQEPPS